MKIILSISYIVACFFHIQVASSSIDDDIGLNITQYAPKYGYPLETHELQTEDGYILTFHRIPHGKTNANTTQKKKVVFMMHGIFSSNMDWLNAGPGKGLGFLLADNGYDVWLGIQRGSTGNKRHAILDPAKNASQFWDFSFYDLAVYDVAAYIDYIVNKTGVEKMYYVAHSQGTALFFALMSSKPEYNKYIKLGVQLAPAAFLGNATHPLVRLFTPLQRVFEMVGNVAGLYEIFPHRKIYTQLGKMFCKDGNPLQHICAGIIFMFGGFDSEQMNKMFLEATQIIRNPCKFAFASLPQKYFNHIYLTSIGGVQFLQKSPTFLNEYKYYFKYICSKSPAGASLKQVLQILQYHRSGRFERYDYGSTGNLKKYGSTKPPGYDFSKITAPVALFTATNDWFSHPKDIDHLVSVLPNVVVHKIIAFEKFRHIDFLWAKDVVDLVYKYVLEYMENAENS